MHLETAADEGNVIGSALYTIQTPNRSNGTNLVQKKGRVVAVYQPRTVQLAQCFMVFLHFCLFRMWSRIASELFYSEHRMVSERGRVAFEGRRERPRRGSTSSTLTITTPEMVRVLDDASRTPTYRPAL